MNFPFKTVPRAAPPPPIVPKGGLTAAWTRDPKTGRLAQNWRSSDDGERSCMGRLGAACTRLPLAA